MKKVLDQCDRCGLTCVFARNGSTNVIEAFDIPERVPADALVSPRFVIIPAIAPHRPMWRSLERHPHVLPNEVPARRHAESCTKPAHRPRRYRHPSLSVR